MDGQYIAYTFFHVDPAWRRLPVEERAAAKEVEVHRIPMRQMQRQRRSPVEHEFARYFGQFVPKRPLWRGKNFKMRQKVAHT